MIRSLDPWHAITVSPTRPKNRISTAIGSGQTCWHTSFRCTRATIKLRTRKAPRRGFGRVEIRDLRDESSPRITRELGDVRLQVRGGVGADGPKRLAHRLR